LFALRPLLSAQKTKPSVDLLGKGMDNLHSTPSKEITMFALNQACAEPKTSQVSINELAERRLRSNPYLALKSLLCVYLDGVLFLRGCLPTYYLKQLAQEAVADLNGVDRIDNQIQVVTPTFR
jgi:hypothetical protein